MTNEVLNIDYTVVEVSLELKGNYTDEIISKAIDTFLEDAPELTDGFDQVNYVGKSEDKNQAYIVHFFAPGLDFSANQEIVEAFLTHFIKDISSEESKQDWLDVLETEKLPIIENYKITKVRKYNW